MVQGTGSGENPPEQGWALPAGTCTWGGHLQPQALGPETPQPLPRPSVSCAGIGNSGQVQPAAVSEKCNTIN